MYLNVAMPPGRAKLLFLVSYLGVIYSAAGEHKGMRSYAYSIEISQKKLGMKGAMKGPSMTKGDMRTTCGRTQRSIGLEDLSKDLEETWCIYVSNCATRTILSG